MRLVNRAGHSSIHIQEGRVEIYYEGKWGTVCSRGWDDKDANVICEQLRFGRYGKAVLNAAYMEGSGPIWLSDVRCSGDEESLGLCDHGGWGSNNCGHDEDASVECGAHLGKYMSLAYRII